MSVSITTAAETLHAERRQLSRGAMMSRVWEAIRAKRQSAQDRSVARWVRASDHEGVAEDYRVACRGNYR